jgi:hypothetical protein
VTNKTAVEEVDTLLSWWMGRSLLPYDWVDYFPEKWIKLKDEWKRKDKRIKELEKQITELTAQTYKDCVFGDDANKRHSHEVCENCEYAERDEHSSIVGCFYSPMVVNMPLELAKSLGGILEDKGGDKDD